MANKRGQREGSIRKVEKIRKDGSKYMIYEARYTIGFNSEGKQSQKSIYGKSRDEVSKKLTAALNSINTGVYIEPHKMTVSNWIDVWLETYKKPSVKVRTYSCYESAARLHIKPAIGNILLINLRADSIQQLYNSVAKKLSPRMAEITHVTLNSALEQAVKNDMIIRNYSQATTLPKAVKEEMRVLTPEEQQQFTRAAENDRYRGAFLLDLFTGLRCGELLALKWNNIDFKKRELKVCQTIGRVKNYDENAITKTKIVIDTPKTPKSQRVIPLLDESIAELKAHKLKQAEEKFMAGDAYNDNGFVFCNELGQPVDTRTFTAHFHKVVKNAGVDKANIHAMRHTFATRGLENGIELKVMQYLLGHSTIEMTAKYSHVLEDKKREAINKLQTVYTQNIN